MQCTFNVKNSVLCFGPIYNYHFLVILGDMHWTEMTFHNFFLRKYKKCNNASLVIFLVQLIGVINISLQSIF